MAEISKTIWQVPAYLPYLQPPLTDKAVAAAEEAIGFTLPPEYLDLLRTQNGGYIRLSLPELVHDCIAGIGPYFPSLTEFNWDACQECVSFPLHGLVPFDGDGHWHICLDYRNDSAKPTVSYIDIEDDQEEPDVAASFAEYLTLLRLDVEGEYVLESVSDIEAIKSQLSSRLAVTFDPPDTWTQGYPLHRTALGTEYNPQWLWLSPNNVSRGFVRSDEPRYDELKDLMPGNALRYPEIPDDSFVLSASSDIRSKVLNACADSKIPVRPLCEYVTDT